MPGVSRVRPSGGLYSVCAVMLEYFVKPQYNSVLVSPLTRTHDMLQAAFQSDVRLAEGRISACYSRCLSRNEGGPREDVNIPQHVCVRHVYTVHTHTSNGEVEE